MYKQCFLETNNRFITADKVAGGKGFRAVWTEVKPPARTVADDCDEVYHYRCVNSTYCVARQLICDGILNCGPNDDSDEAHCNYASPFSPRDHLVPLVDASLL